MKQKNVAIFGSTGSIGCNTLQVIRENRDKFYPITLVARNNVVSLIKQIKEFNPKHVYIYKKSHADMLRNHFPNLDIFYGDTGLNEIAQLTDADISISALVGIAGLEPTYYMIKNCKQVALANKEVLVTGGELITNFATSYETQLLTVDSEHSAIFQCLQGEENNPIDKILLTASGGPFRTKEITDSITPLQALNHPTWNMGKKVTIDSATMMNKGFEVIEAKWLFNISISKIQVVVHPQSLVHSMVQFQDGTIMANIGPSSMQIPIAYALNYPVRLPNTISKLDLFAIQSLYFEKPNLEKFPCLSLAYQAIQSSPSHQVVLNATDEIAVQAFLDKKIAFTDIPKIIENMLSQYTAQPLSSISDILTLDSEIKNRLEYLLK